MLAADVRGRLRSLAATRHSIGARLLTGVLLFSGAVTLILTVIQLYLDYRREVSAIDLRLNQISESYLDSLAEGLWTFDEKQLRLQLDGILRLPDIRAVEVREAGTTGNPFIVKLGENSESSAYAREYPLRYKVQGQNRVIGMLRVEATLVDVYRRLVHTASTILVSQAATIFLVSLFILYVFYRLVTRHLSAIAAYVGSYRINDPPSELRLRRRSPPVEDELQRVITAFNTLSDNLNIAYRDLHDLNDELAQDVAARRQAEAAVREREAKIRRLVDANIIGIFIWDFDGRILEANEAFLQIVGYDREDLLAGRLRWTDLTPPDWHERDAQWIEEHKRTGFLPPFEKEYFRKNGSRAPVLIGVATFEEGGSQGVAFVIDLSERKRAEEVLHKTQAELAHVTRVLTMGELASSIAHEVNQPLAAVITNANACLRWLAAPMPDLDEAREAVGRIIRDGNRASDVIARIRALVKKSGSEQVRLDINEVIQEVVGLLQSEIQKNGVVLRMELGGNLPQVLGDRVQLQQVMMNLVMNGIEAMNGVMDRSRDLFIRSRQYESAKVLVAVQDSGVGLRPEGLDQLFTAFFTTKPKGMGLGLAISRSIVENQGGRLWAVPNGGPGATFQFTLLQHRQRDPDVPRTNASNEHSQ